MTKQTAKTAEKLTRKQFADRIGVVPSYITKLGKDGRLVFTENGKHVLVESSIARIEETRDPGRDDVTDRHKRNRDKKNNGSDGEQQPDETNTSYSASRAIKEHYSAQTAKVEHEKLVGTLCETGAVHHAAGEAGTITRAIFENLADQIAPILAAESSEGRVHALLVEHIEQALHDVADRTAAAIKAMAES